FAFAEEVEETPELKAKIQNIVNTMPEDDAIEAIEDLFGENDRPHFATRSASNFAIYRAEDDKKKDELSMANDAFKGDAKIYKEDGDVVIELTTTPIYFMGRQADVTEVTVIGKSGEKFVAANKDLKDPITRHHKEVIQVPGRVVISIPETEIKGGEYGYNSLLDVEFKTNLRDDFAIGFGNLFPDKMVNPKARLVFNK
ncbi:hypothetical protein, partial [Anaerococcus obesiensis]